MLVVRDELAEDQDAVHKIVLAAFENSDEAALVNRLRPVSGVVSLVAEEDSELVGHIMFSPVQLLDQNGKPVSIKIAGLAPVGVLPDYQRNGVGKALVNAGLTVCKQSGFAACVLLGSPDYYPKFGFRPAFSTFGLTSTYNVSDPIFMALELKVGALENISGTIHYHPTFNGI